MAGSLHKGWEWFIGGDFNMTERENDKSHHCGREINDLEKYSWNKLLITLQVHYTFSHQEAQYFHGTMGKSDMHKDLLG